MPRNFGDRTLVRLTLGRCPAPPLSFRMSSLVLRLCGPPFVILCLLSFALGRCPAPLVISCLPSFRFCCFRRHRLPVPTQNSECRRNSRISLAFGVLSRDRLFFRVYD